MREQSILFFTSSLKGGGAEKVADRLAKYFFDNKQEKVSMLTLRSSDSPQEYYNLYSLNAKNTRFAFFSLKKFLDKNPHQVVLSFNRQLTILLLLSRFVFGYKFKIVARNITMLTKSRSYQKSFWHRYFSDGVVKIFYRFSDIVVAQSNLMADDLLSNYRIKKEKIKVIYNPINLSSFTIENTRKRNRVIFVGSLEPVKNLDFLLESFSYAVGLKPALTLHIIGSGKERLRLETKVSDLRIIKHVNFIGYVNDVTPFYKEADLIALTSLYEGLPNVLIEANSFGVPAIALDTDSGANEIVLSGENGFLLKTTSPKEFGELIVKSLDYPWEVKQIVDSTRRFEVGKIGNEYFLTLNGMRS